jgi:hypothetical protein
MYYIIENKNQLEKFSEYRLSNCYVDVITGNDRYHNALSNPILIYIKPFESKSGFIIPINHNEAHSIDEASIIDLLTNYVGQIYAIDAKRLLHSLKVNKPLKCLKTALYLAEGRVLEESEYDTQAHRFFYNRYGDLNNVNNLIPISKHYEKLENIIKKIPDLSQVYKTTYYELYGSVAQSVFYRIERSGITINKEILLNHFKVKNPKLSIRDNKVYTSYNVFTATGRPSNSFNNINFSALKKDDDTRASFVASMDYLVEYDYSSYHLRILCNLIDYSFEEKDIHTHLAKYYFQKDSINEQEYNESKALTFKLLYTESIKEEIEDIDFFKKVREYKNNLWESYKKTGVLYTNITKRPITNIENKTQLLPYILQAYETEYNILILDKVLNLLDNFDSKLVAYCYDSFLIDYSKNDGKDILYEISCIFEQDRYKTSCKYGRNYHEMKSI